MKRLIRSRIGLLVGIVVFVLSVSLTLLLRPPQIATMAIAPLVSQTAPVDPVILTVEDRDGGMVVNRDEYLRLRVYLSGRIESDSFEGTDFNHRTRRTAMLDEVRLANVKRALEQRDLLACKDEYPQFAIYTDTWTNSTMTFKVGNETKRITLTNPDSDDPSNIANYPKALLYLLHQVDEITDHFNF